MSSVIKARYASFDPNSRSEPIAPPANGAERVGGVPGGEQFVRRLIHAATLNYVATHKAESIVADARARAEAIVAQAEADRDAIVEEARAEGIVAGRSEGHRQAFAEAEVELAAKKASLARLADEMAGVRNEIVQQYERDIVELAVRLAGKLLRNEGGPSVETARSLLADMLQRTSGVSDVTISANPADLQILRRDEAHPAARNEDRATIVWKEDDRLASGSVVVETERGNLDGTFAVRARRLVEHLLEVMHDGD